MEESKAQEKLEFTPAEVRPALKQERSSPDFSEDVLMLDLDLMLVDGLL